MKDMAIHRALGLITLLIWAGANAQAEPSSSAMTPELLIGRCTVCHGKELIAQQRLDRRQWEAVVHKMRTWGAQLTDDDAAALIRHLAAAYGPEAPDERVLHSPSQR